MKTLLITATLLIGLYANALAKSPALPVTPRPEPGTYALTITLANVTQRAGKVYIGIANDEATFAGASYRKTRIDVPATGEVSVNFTGLPPGTYAVRVFQDLNENQKIDFNGPMPTEPYGFSTITSLMGPPTFGLCAFDLSADKLISITLSSL